jgi:NAD(P)-dependent dehydrogenase (short-subunit alcohol dehydrogenase family)
VIEEFGKLDILVNNAGTNPVQVPFLDEVYDNERLWDSIINLNLKGPYFLTRAVAKVMKEQGRGNIINISSIDGVVPGVGESIYDISKAGLIHLTKIAAKDLAEYNIRVNCIIPGMVKTRMSGVLVKQPEAAKPWNAGIPMGRFAGPDEIAGAAVYLASDASSYATGACITVDGGVLCMGNPAPKDWTFTGK